MSYSVVNKNKEIFGKVKEWRRMMAIVFRWCCGDHRMVDRMAMSVVYSGDNDGRRNKDGREMKGKKTEKSETVVDMRDGGS